MHLSRLFLYPVKALRGCEVTTAEVDPLGLVGDRRFMVVTAADGRFLTQRVFPRLALISTGLGPASLTLSTDGRRSLSIPRASDPAAVLRTVSVWKSEGLLAEDCGEAPAAWLSEFLGTAVRLVRCGEKFRRPILKPAAGPGDLVNLSDAYPLMAISEASLEDLNRRLEAQGEEIVPLNRFRPSLVFAGCAAYAEDTWPRFRLGEVVLRSGGPCVRCIVTTTDQLSGERGKEPLRTLATYRRARGDPTDVEFGQNLIHETKAGALRVGDPMTLLA